MFHLLKLSINVIKLVHLLKKTQGSNN